MDYFKANFPPSHQTPELVLTRSVAILCMPVDKLEGAPESDNYIRTRKGVITFHAQKLIQS